MDSARIRDAVDRAFAAFNSLTVTATLEKEILSGFDFGTGDIQSTPSNTTVTVMFLETSYKDGSAVHRYVAKAADFNTDMGYTALLIGDDRYFIEKATIYEGVVLLDLKGENGA